MFMISLKEAQKKLKNVNKCDKIQTNQPTVVRTRMRTRSRLTYRANCTFNGVKSVYLPSACWLVLLLLLLLGVLINCAWAHNIISLEVNEGSVSYTSGQKRNKPYSIQKCFRHYWHSFYLYVRTICCANLTRAESGVQHVSDCTYKNITTIMY